jgi:hypothetical protein
MTTSVLYPQVQNDSPEASLQPKVERMIDDLVASLPNPIQLTSQERRGIIARYTAVLEGNFIYWMTAALLAIKSEEARPIILENLHEEVRDAHPAMMRRFAIAANAFPTGKDAMDVNDDLTRMRLFMGKLSGVQSLLAMGFFEGFIQKFMGYLADLAKAQGSTDMEYTDVHGVCDIAHTQGLFTALSTEVVINPLDADADPLEGVHILYGLMNTVIFTPANELAA